MLLLRGRPGDIRHVANIGPDVQIQIISVKGDYVLFGVAPMDEPAVEPETTTEESKS